MLLNPVVPAKLRSFTEPLIHVSFSSRSEGGRYESISIPAPGAVFLFFRTAILF